MKTLLKTLSIVTIIIIAGGCSNSVDLFDDKTLEGWEIKPAGKNSHWWVEEGLLVGENSDSIGSMLWTTRNYKDYELELEWITLTKDYDTGVFPRGNGPQVQIGISSSLKKDFTACIYAPKDGKGKYPAQTDKVAEFHKVGEWNHLKVIVTGKRIQTILNGEPFVDYESETLADEGPIGLQLHPKIHMKAKFRNIRITEL